MYKINKTKTIVKAGFSQQQTKRNNTMLLFKLIRKNDGISRSALAEMTGLSATTVSMLVEELINNGLVRQSGTSEINTPGRKPVMLFVNPSGAYFVLVEIINTGVICYLYNLNIEYVDSVQYRFSSALTSSNILTYIKKLLDKNMVNGNLLYGINIVYPGKVDRAGKALVHSTVVPYKVVFGYDDSLLLSGAFKNAVILINNYSNNTAYAEYIVNKYTGSKPLISINIFEAVGAGVIFVNSKGEKILDFPMEFGHMILDKNGPMCKCSKHGCVEAMVSVVAIFERLKKEANLVFDYSEEFNNEKNITAMQIIRNEMQTGNQKALAVLDDIANSVAHSISNLYSTLDAGAIYISGTFCYLGPDFLATIKNKILGLASNKENSPETVDLANIITFSKLSNEQRISGGISMLLDEVFSNESD